ncbi:outer membrane usher protein [Serratia fonticola]|jgi:outer membrane usher protein PapC|uniref:outer membrane usher protein n=1 Tax=Serratia fonticola TaxID=47917 RepID=UPI002178054B|nr:outer membrane usher protein [Serratia fonticola]CAI1010389.1 Outer membrane usher protein papC precursor [Serratia fonticola]CAI1011534.1 Outer membrane usher protein papC precursor [Serratia fonticola]CAI1805412.1 Outer membrane usher protein papC precursor [Serratia fonticola]
MAKPIANTTFRLRGLWICIALSLGSPVYLTHAADDIQFNTDVLDIKDRENLDLSHFSRGGYIMPGTYTMMVFLNRQQLAERPITFAPSAADPKSSEPCLTPELIDLLGLKDSALNHIVWQNGGQCADPQSIPGLMAQGDLGTSALQISVPQAYLEYSSAEWDPPSRWDNGITGLLFDYNMNFLTTRQQHQDQVYNLSGNGTTGANFGPWRLRADWQMQMNHQSGANAESRENSLDWSRYYVYRALPKLLARLTLGENYLNSDIFDSFRFTGVTLNTDDNMLPPNLRGYAPEVSGVAKSNAKVTISQQGRVLYETQVAPGPFRIQDLNDAVSGQLLVRIEEQDGSVRQFTMNTASIPYLTRPGSLRYKLSAGRPTDWQHNVNGQLFASGEFSWGVSNGWSLYGGGVGGDDYDALALGVGRDLMMLGALSFDVTHSRARLPDEGSLFGNSYRLSYSKRFEDYDSQVTFAGYRFSERNFMSMGEFLDAQVSGTRTQSSKEMYTVTFNKQFVDLGLSAFINYSHQTYWNDSANDHYNLSLARYFDLGKFKDLNLSLTAYRNKYNGTTDDGMYLTLTIPWDNSGSISYNGSWDRNDNSHQMSYFGRVNNADSYQVSAGSARQGAIASGYYTHQGDSAQVSANAGYQAGRSSSLGMSMQGGITATMEGAALHRIGMPGGTRILLDTDGVADVPLRGYGATTLSNRFGKAVVADINSYYRNQISIDLNSLGDKIEAINSVQQATLTEGAIGFRRFEVVAGDKAMAVVRLADGSSPPFGATVQNGKNRDVGILNDDGSVYLSGIQPGAKMTANWNGIAQCEITLPMHIPQNGTQNLLLPCRPIAAKESSVTKMKS